MQLWPGPDTDEVTVADELAFDALALETQMLARRVVRHRLVQERDPSVREEWDEENDELEAENDALRAALEKIADGTVTAADVETFAKGALAA